MCVCLARVGPGRERVTRRRGREIVHAPQTAARIATRAFRCGDTAAPGALRRPACRAWRYCTAHQLAQSGGQDRSDTVTTHEVVDRYPFPVDVGTAIEAAAVLEIE